MVDLRFLLIAACMFLSGFAGLLYETVWARQFSIVFGSSELAVVAVLAGYFGGLTAGAAVAARYAARVKRPILAYGLLEAGIALCALAVPWAVDLLTRLYVGVFSGASETVVGESLGRTCFQLGASFAILLIPTALMGATLPLLARQAVRVDSELGGRVGLLYATNTLGAVAGTLSVAFVLLPALGQRQTTLVGVAANGLVFAGAALLARATPPLPLAPPIAWAAPPDAGRVRWVLPLILLSGLASFGYEVLWTRLLSHLLGGSMYAFATMLASFLIGIAIGSAIGSRLARDAARAARAFGWAQIGTAMLSMAAFTALDRLPELARSLRAGGRAGLFADAAVALAIILPSALCIGATFPLAVRVLAQHDLEAGAATGRIYAWNTVGAIFGSVGTGLWVLPQLGYAGALAAIVAINLLLAAMAALLGGRARTLGTAAVLGLALLLAIRPHDPWNLLRASPLGSQAIIGDAAYYSVGRSATVLLIDDHYGWELRTNGLPEARIWRPGTRPPGVQVTRWLSGLPALIRPDARRLLVIGLGGAVTLESAPATLSSIDVVELEPDVVEANRQIASQRADDPLGDARVHVRVADARSALLLARTRYDAIVSQPSHPWTSGASHLYTREFFALARGRLTPTGVFVQWMGLGFVDPPLLKCLVATFADVFRHVQVYAPEPGALLFVGCDAPLPDWWADEMPVTADWDRFLHLGVASREDLALALVLDETGARAFAAGTAVNTDDFNRLEAGSPRALRAAGLGREQLDADLAPFDRLPQVSPAFNRGYLVRRLLARGDRARALRVADAAPTPTERQLCKAWVFQAQGDQRRAAANAERALRRDPRSAGARFLSLSLNRAALLEGDPAALAVARAAEDPEQAVFEGWRLEAEERWRELRGLESRLTSPRVTDEVFSESRRLRALWRIRSGDEPLAAEAVALLDAPVLLFARPRDLLLRIEAQVAAGDPVGGLRTLWEMTRDLPKGPAGSRLAGEARSVLRALPLPAGITEAERLSASLDERLSSYEKEQ